MIVVEQGQGLLIRNYVQECLGNLHDLAYLEAHPLARLVTVSRQRRPGEALRRALLEAIEELRPPGAEDADTSAQWRRYRCLQLRYEQGLTLDTAARRLGVSARQASRDQQQAVASVANLLSAYLARERAGATAETGLPPRPVSDGSDALEAELDQVVAATSEGPTDLTEVVRGVIGTIAEHVEIAGVEIELSLSDAISPVAVVRTILRQALFNLFGFAVELGAGTRIDLTVADTSRGVELTLDIRRQRGRPIAAPDRSVSPPTAEAMLSTGRRLLEIQGAVVELGYRVDGGLSIEVILPVVHLRRVLVIDDNPDVVGLFRRYLRRASYRLIQAGSAESALRLAAELHPDVITLDLMMPTQDGWEILQRLRGAEWTRSIPVIVCSALPEDSLARSLGVAAFLAKPVTRASLLTVLDHCIPPAGAVHPNSPSGRPSLPRH